jgi:phage terminase small subunit
LSLDAAEWLIAAASAQSDFMQWRAASLNETMIIETEAGPKAHPAHQQHRLARKAWLDILKEGGLTPASVVRVKMPEAPDEEPGDPFTAIDAKRDARAQIRRVK